MGCFSLKGMKKQDNTLRLRSPYSFLGVDSLGGGRGCLYRLTHCSTLN